MKNFIKSTLLLCLSLAISFLIAEFTIRTIFPFKSYGDERNLTYEHNELLGWFPLKNSNKKYLGSRLIDVHHNNYGFRDDDYKFNLKKKNIIFSGDSFTWGYDVNKSDRFTDIIRSKLNKNKYDIYNFGVSGYGTDQSFLLLKEYYDKVRPDIVFLAFCGNDFGDNSVNAVYQGYFKPYFEVINNRLELKGLPVPIAKNYKALTIKEDYPILSKSHFISHILNLFWKYQYKLFKIKVKDPTYEILKEMNKFLSDNNTRFIVGIIDKDNQLEKFLSQNNIEYIDLNNSFRYDSHGNHWTPDGHKLIAKQILQHLRNTKPHL